MGKAARNERRKIFANYLNGVAIGSFLGGAFLPMYSAIKVGENSEELRLGATGAFGVITAFGCSLFLFRHALKKTDEIED